MASTFPALDGSAPAKKRFDAAPEMGIDTSKRYTATIDTSMGSIVVALDAINAPKTVNNFVLDRKSTRLNSSHSQQSRMPSSA